MALGSDNYRMNVYLSFINDEAATTRVAEGVSTIDKELAAINETMKHIPLSAKEAGAEMQRTFSRLDVSIKQTRQNLERLRNIASSLGQISRGLFAGGAGAVAGIFALANSYVKDAKVATTTTVAWNKELDKIASAKSRIGAVFAKEALPALRTAADIARKIASFVETNPSLVKAALNVGLITAGVGVMGMLLSQGVRFIADVGTIAASTAQLTAGKLMDMAANKQLLAAGTMGKQGIGSGLSSLFSNAKIAGLFGAGGTLAGLASAAGVLLAAFGGLAIGVKAYDTLVKKNLLGFGGLPRAAQFATGSAFEVGNRVLGPLANLLGANLDTKEIERKSTVFAAIIGKLTGAIDENSPLWIKAAASIKKSSEVVEAALDGLANPEIRSAALSAFTEYKDGIAKLEADTAQERIRINTDTSRALTQASTSYSAKLRQIASNLSSSIAKETSSFQREDARALQDFNKQRADIAREAGIESVKIEEKLRKDLEDLQRESNNRLRGLIDQRDALGIDEELRRRKEEERAKIQDANDEQRQLKAETGRRLQELTIQYNAERAQRYADFQAKIADIQAQAAEERKQAAINYAEERRQINEQRLLKLRDLQVSMNAERQRLYQGLVQKLRDIDAGLLGERNLRKAYNDRMLLELNQFLASYKTGMSSLLRTSSVSGARATGGYVASEGLYRLAEQNSREYVLNNNVTRALERALGADLTDGALMRLALTGGNRITYNDSRRINGGVSARTRRDLQRDTFEVLSSLM